MSWKRWRTYIFIDLIYSDMKSLIGCTVLFKKISSFELPLKRCFQIYSPSTTLNPQILTEMSFFLSQNFIFSSTFSTLSIVNELEEVFGLHICGFDLLTWNLIGCTVLFKKISLFVLLLKRWFQKLSFNVSKSSNINRNVIFFSHKTLF